ncbi:MAG: DUF4112 domain-containing protein [Tunicatimonas sp.]
MKSPLSKRRKPTTGTPELKWVDKITHLMDSKFKVPGTQFRFGLDPILGLVPGLGDAASLAVSGSLIYYMARFGASRKLVLMMIGNVILDATIGSIPILGNIFDFAYKANQRNVRMLKRYHEEGKYRGSGKGILVSVVVIFAGLIGLVLYGTWELAEYVLRAAGDLG